MEAYQNPPEKFDRLRRQAEELIHISRPMEAPPAGDDILELIQELKIHQAELEIQNEELKRAQLELSDLHRQYERLYEFAPCGYVTLNPKGIITRVNLTAVSLLGAPRMHLLRSVLSTCIADGWQGALLKARANAARTGEKERLELQLKRETGPPLWVRADITADRDEREAVVQWCVVLMDISREKEAEEALRLDEEEKQRLGEKLRHAQKMETLGTLAGGVAHEFNNILMIILGNHDLMKDALPDWSPLNHNLERIRSAAIRSRDVVRQLLAFARKGDTRQTPLNISDVVRETLMLIRSTLPANIHIEQRLPADIDPILGNSTQINQLMINLCANAAGAMLPAGGQLTVEVANVTLDAAGAGRHRRLRPGAHVRLLVADTGCGMDAATLAHIFEPYFTTKPFGKGSGIGLAVVHGIIEQHNGEIITESKVGQGTVFTILLPAYPGPVEAEPPVSPDLPKGHESLLLVDDEAAIGTVGQYWLSGLGYTVTVTTDPREALERMQADPQTFDLVITDMAMPHMSGVELSTRLLALRADLPIVLCTGYSEGIDETTARGMGLAGFLMKPAGRADVAIAVRQALDRAKETGAVR